ISVNQFRSAASASYFQGSSKRPFVYNSREQQPGAAALFLSGGNGPAVIQFSHLFWHWYGSADIAR
ncbi:MAG: hypothetical protein KJZ86_25015, partial [Caldilineaceae bacterium]|nr:hypothetical protein [Caldilineaceae bacterium]